MRFQRSVLLYIGSVLLCGLGLTAFCIWRYPLGGSVADWMLFAGLAFLVWLSDRNGLHLTQGTNIHVDTIPLFTSVLVLNPAMAMLVACLGRVFGRIDRRRIPMAERAFNLGQTLVYVGVSALLLDYFSHTPWSPNSLSDWIGVLAAVAAIYLLNTLIVAGIVAVDTHQGLLGLWFSSLPLDLLEQSVMFGFGLLAGLVVAPHRWALILMALPSIAVFVTLDRTLKMEAQQKKLAETNAELASHLSTQAEQLRNAYAILEDALDAKNQMLQNVSHELRTPMVAVAGYTEALQDGLYGALTQPQLGALEIISRNTQNMIRLVNDLLTLQALDRGQLQVEETGVAQVLFNCQDNFAQRAESSGIELKVETEQGLPMLHADPIRLEQAIGNLVDNAIKFSPDGGAVTLRARCVDQDHIEISVSDHGIGIPADELPNIYRRFYQVDGSLTRQYGGQGLGLAITRRVIELHGGTIRADSHVGLGTTFYVEMPIGARS